MVYQDATPTCLVRGHCAENRPDRRQNYYWPNMAKSSEHGIRLSCVCISASAQRMWVWFRRGVTMVWVCFPPFLDEPSLPEQQQHQSHLALQRRGRVSGWVESGSGPEPWQNPGRTLVPTARRFWVPRSGAKLRCVNCVSGGDAADPAEEKER